MAEHSEGGHTRTPQLRVILTKLPSSSIIEESIVPMKPRKRRRDISPRICSAADRDLDKSWIAPKTTASTLGEADKEEDLSKSTRNSWSSADTKAVMDSFIYESKQVEQRWNAGNITDTDKDAAAAFLELIGAVQMNVAPVPEETAQEFQAQDTQRNVTDGEGQPCKEANSSKRKTGKAKRELPVWACTDDDWSDDDDGAMDFDDCIQLTSDDDTGNHVQGSRETLQAPETHQAERSEPREEHPCSVCNAMFHSLWELDMHKLNGCKKGEGPCQMVYNCDQCSMSFIVKHHAIKHLFKAHDVPVDHAIAKLESLQATERQQRRREYSKVKKRKRSLRKRRKGSESLGNEKDTKAEIHSGDEQSPGGGNRSNTLKLENVDHGQDKPTGESQEQDGGPDTQEANVTCISGKETGAEGVKENAKETSTTASADAWSNENNEVAGKGAGERDTYAESREVQDPRGDSDEHVGSDGSTASPDKIQEPEDQTGGHEEETVASRQVDKTGDNAGIQQEHHVASSASGEELDTDLTSIGKEDIKGSVVCQICNIKCKSQYYLRKHMRTHYGDEEFKCSTCDRIFFDKRDLKQHLPIHKADRKVYRCKICSKTYMTKYYYIAHMKSHFEKPERFKCSFCDVEVSTKKVLELHINSQHTKEKQFPCDQCGKVFFQEYHLRRHKETHKAQREWKCEECGKAFFSSSNLKLHQLNVHRAEGACLCELCGAAYKTQGNLKQHHLTAHTDEFRFSCDICGKKFKRSSHLNAHMKVHNNERPFKCEMCEKGFRNKSKLKVHVNWHYNIRPFTCDICGKSFLTKGNLDKHNYVHSRMRPHSCMVCGRGFIDLPGLRKHLDKVHNVTLKKVVTEGTYEKELGTGPAPSQPQQGVPVQSSQTEHSLQSNAVSASQPNIPANSQEESAAGNGEGEYPMVEEDESQVVRQALLAMIDP